MQVIASGCHWSKIKMKPIRAIAKTLGLVKSVKRGNALVSLLTTTYPKERRRQLKWIAEFCPWSRKILLEIQSRQKKLSRRYAFHCHSLQSREAFIYVSAKGLQVANHWLDSRTGRADQTLLRGDLCTDGTKINLYPNDMDRKV